MFFYKKGKHFFCIISRNVYSRILSYHITVVHLNLMMMTMLMQLRYIYFANVVSRVNSKITVDWQLAYYHTTSEHLLKLYSEYFLECHSAAGRPLNLHTLGWWIRLLHD